MSRVGLFGGTFDPVHDAHVALAHAALDGLDLDELRWIPAWQPWQKERELAPAADREAMVRLAIEGEPRFVLERAELRRRGTSYTLDTVRELVALEPAHRYVLILGHDQYATLHTWRDWRELLALVELAIARRAGVADVANPRLGGAPYRVVEMAPMAVSSTEVRRRVAAGSPIDDLVPPAVAGYIERKGLYRS